MGHGSLEASRGNLSRIVDAVGAVEHPAGIWLYEVVQILNAARLGPQKCN